MASINRNHDVPDYLLDRILSYMLDVEFYIRGEQEFKRIKVCPEQRKSQSDIILEGSAIRHELKRIAQECDE